MTLWSVTLRLAQWLGIAVAIFAAPTGWPSVMASIGVVTVMLASKALGAMAWEAGRLGR